MIIKFEYVMDNVFSDKTIYYIEKIKNDYYFSSKLLENEKINNEKTVDFINKLLSSLKEYKKGMNVVILDEPIGYINILKESGEVLSFSSENYLFGEIEEMLSEFESSVLRKELE